MISSAERAPGARSARQREILDGQVGPALARLTLPMIVGIAAASFSGAIDAYFIGQLGSRELGAYGFSFPVSLVLNSLMMGLAIGTASVVSRAVGEGRPDRIRQVTTHALWIGLILALVLAALGWLTLRPLFRLLGATPDVLLLIGDYMTVWYTGLPLILLPLIGNNAVRGTGDTRTPSLALLAAAGLNALFDPLLIFGWGVFPRLGLAGAAWASVLSQGLTLVFLLAVLGWREGLLETVRPRLGALLASGGSIGAVAIPAAMTRIVFPLSMLLITGLVASHGPDAVAGLAVAARIETLVMIVILALSASLVPFVGQNWGAGRPERARQGLRASLAFSLLWGLAVSLALFYMAPRVTRMFSRDPEIATAAADYLRIVSWSLGLQGASALVSAAFNAAGRALNATAITLVRMFALYLPLAYLGSHLWGLTGIFAGACAANALVGLGSLGWGEKFFSAKR
jgi:putative MATE family efflux protein